MELAANSTAQPHFEGTMTTPCPPMEQSVMAYLLYATSATVVALIITLIVRECTYRRRYASKYKIKSKQRASSAERNSDIESQTLSQRDRIQSTTSDDIRPFSRDLIDRNGSLKRDPSDHPPESGFPEKCINLEEPTAKGSTLPVTFTFSLKHQVIPKALTLKPGGAATNVNKTVRKTTEEDHCDAYVVADRWRRAKRESDVDGSEGQETDLYVNAQPSGAHRQGRDSEWSAAYGEELYANAFDVLNGDR